MDQRRLGPRTVSAIGLGEMPLSNPGRPDDARAIATIHAALDAGVTLIDTADAYATGAGDVGHGEELVARALARWSGDPSDVLVATKAGHVRTADGGWALDSRPEHLHRAARDSLRRLGGEAIGLLQHHRPDPDVPYAEAIGALRELFDEGLVRLAGISNADIGQIDEARAILGDALVSVQNRFSPAFRASEDELRHCAEAGLAFLPWSPLGGISSAAALGDEHAAFADVAAAHDASPQQVCLAWMLAKGDHVVPIPGSSRPETIRSSAAAADLRLSADELARLDAVPAASG
ncbi:MAG TPA: aldo/keto reductase [Baekduia sp.]|nr:aldo/keto reductase [Baekduia sp.]